MADMIVLAEKAKTKLERVTGLKASSVIGVAQEEGGQWMVTLELIEKKSIPDSMDILGTYEVKMDEAGDVLDFARTRLRKRGDTIEA
ncbi:MAG: gas vesicle protein [Candidatus Omnitrophica bacterium]|nr:gas vesicle protein [Candidatus Omnitrophota bacterium]